MHWWVNAGCHVTQRCYITHGALVCALAAASLTTGKHKLAPLEAQVVCCSTLAFTSRHPEHLLHGLQPSLALSGQAAGCWFTCTIHTLINDRVQNCRMRIGFRAPRRLPVCPNEMWGQKSPSCSAKPISIQRAQ